ncbi:MAG: spermidine synthase, partial [Chloroflexota bacterium]
RRLTLPRPAVLYGVLLVAVLVGWIVPAHALLGLPGPTRFLAGVALWFTPIFIANLVFAQRFRGVEASNVAFGANLLGAMVGGLVEYASLVTGYQTLALVVAALYTLAFLSGRHHLVHRGMESVAGG